MTKINTEEVLCRKLMDTPSFPYIIGTSMDNDLTSLSWLQNTACLLPAISAVPDGVSNAAAAFALSTSRTRERFCCCCDNLQRFRYLQ